MTDALQHLYDRLKAEAYPTAQMGGIYANKPGYHNKRDQLPSSDYSCQQPDDLAGSGQNAAALDITLNPADMRHLTQRLIDLTHAADPRIQILREFFGTLDGVTVTGRDVRTMRVVTSDSSHLWHVHASAFRTWAGDLAAMDDLATAILGRPDPTGDDDVDAHTQRMIEETLSRVQGMSWPFPDGTYRQWDSTRVEVMATQIDALTQAVESLRAELAEFRDDGD